VSVTLKTLRKERKIVRMSRLSGGVARDLLEAPWKRLLASGGLVNAGFAVSSVFVSLFFYVTSGSVTKMALYSLGNYTGLTLGFLAMARWFPETSPRRLFRAGLALNAMFYLLLIVLGRQAGALALELGLVGGMAAGTYWLGANTLTYDVLSPEGRGRYYGFNFAITSVLNFVMPLSAGVVIGRLGGQTGFVAVFAIALSAFVLAWWAARGLSTTPGIGGVPLRRVLAVPPVRTEWGRMWLALGMRGFKQAAGGLGLIVLIALATHSSTAQGEFAAVASLAGVGTSVLAGRLRPASRALGMWVGAVGFAATTVMLFFGADFAMLMAYGALSGFVYPGLMVPLAASVLDVIDADPAAAQLRGAYMLSQEVAINAGRIAAVLVLLALLAAAKPVEAVVVVLGVAAALQLAAAHLGAAALEQSDTSRGARRALA
jgi:YQGE family putative transporter